MCTLQERKRKFQTNTRSHQGRSSFKFSLFSLNRLPSVLKTLTVTSPFWASGSSHWITMVLELRGRTWTLRGAEPGSAKRKLRNYITEKKIFLGKKPIPVSFYLVTCTSEYNKIEAILSLSSVSSEENNYFIIFAFWIRLQQPHFLAKPRQLKKWPKTQVIICLIAIPLRICRARRLKNILFERDVHSFDLNSFSRMYVVYSFSGNFIFYISFHEAMNGVSSLKRLHFKELTSTFSCWCLSPRKRRDNCL